MVSRAGHAIVAMIVVDDESAGASEPQSDREPSAVALARLRLLLVEDDFLVGMEAEYGLSEAGYEIAGIAASADEAVILAERERPLLVVMDIRLAGERDGVDAAIEIRSRLGIGSLFVSANADPATLARAEAADPLGWVVKPYRLSVLVEAVAKAVDEIAGREPAPEPAPAPRPA